MFRYQASPLFEELRIGRLCLQNRIVMPAITLFYTRDSTFNIRLIKFYERRVLGRPGLIIIPMAVEKRGGTPYLPAAYMDDSLEKLREFVKNVHSTSRVKIGVQLLHLGRYARKDDTGVEPVAPSSIFNPITKETPRTMQKEDMEEIKVAYKQAAQKLSSIGVDYIEIHAAGGYLLNSFLSPYTNKRDDEYGGSFENRMRFPLEVISEVIKEAGEKVPVGLRISGCDFLRGGLSLQEVASFCRMAVENGISCINVTGGWHESPLPQVTSHVPEGAFVYLAEFIKAEVGEVCVLASNRLGDPFLCEWLLKNRCADGVCWGRPLLADPDLPAKLAEGRFKECNWCIACGHCLDCIFRGEPVSCTVNPEAGKEYLDYLNKGEGKKQSSGPKFSPRKTILVIGGGVAGLSAAVYAAKRGHFVRIYEKGTQIGGVLRALTYFPWKKTFRNYLQYLEHCLDHYKIEVTCCHEVRPEELGKQVADVIIIATGARPYVPEDLKEKIGRISVLTALDVLQGADVGKDVVIIGGGGTGCELALLLSNFVSLKHDIVGFFVKYGEESGILVTDLLRLKKRNVVIIEKESRIGRDLGPTYRWILLRDLRRAGVRILNKANILTVNNGRLEVSIEGGHKEVIPFDTIVVATGFIADFSRWEEEARHLNIPVFYVGDVKAPAKVINAVHEAWDVVSHI